MEQPGRPPSPPARRKPPPSIGLPGLRSSPRQEVESPNAGGLGRMLSYEFVSLSAEQRQQMREKHFEMQTQQVLGGGWKERERPNAAVKRLARIDDKIEARQLGVTEWDLKRKRSREVLRAIDEGDGALPTSPRPGCSPSKGGGLSPSKADVSLSLFSSATEFGPRGQSYVSLTPQLSKRLAQAKTPQAPPTAKPPAPPVGSRRHSEPPPEARAGAAAATPSSAALAEARAELARLEHGGGAAAPQETPGASATTPPPASGLLSPVAFNADGRFSYGNFRQDNLGIDLSKLSHQDFAKVQIAAKVLREKFPNSDYLRPFFERVREASASAR
eukprot:TRINITY_DN16041_c0_g1_i2.p1 TRINITY_DN16041_c0_g1~~TRINITY_DN16041_c0_g1_i2.p1  ORF type:complete len:356 (+),score=111.27 TRINITY_DN16041_c0_g1_i2:76-1068(+)